MVCGPYERAHALALAEAVVADEELMAVVEPLLPHVSVEEIRGEIAAAPGGRRGRGRGRRRRAGRLRRVADGRRPGRRRAARAGSRRAEDEVRAGFAPDRRPAHDRRDPVIRVIAMRAPRGSPPTRRRPRADPGRQRHRTDPPSRRRLGQARGSTPPPGAVNQAAASTGSSASPSTDRGAGQQRLAVPGERRPARRSRLIAQITPARPCAEKASTPGGRSSQVSSPSAERRALAAQPQRRPVQLQRGRRVAGLRLRRSAPPRSAGAGSHDVVAAGRAEAVRRRRRRPTGSGTRQPSRLSPGAPEGRVLRAARRAGRAPRAGPAPRPGRGTPSRAARASAGRPRGPGAGPTSPSPYRVTCRCLSWLDSTQVVGAPTSVGLGQRRVDDLAERVRRPRRPSGSRS